MPQGIFLHVAFMSVWYGLPHLLLSWSSPLQPGCWGVCCFLPSLVVLATWGGRMCVVSYTQVSMARDPYVKVIGEQAYEVLYKHLSGQ